MAPTSPADLENSPSSSPKSDAAANPNLEHYTKKTTNQDLPTRSMSEEAQDSHVHKDDAATIAAGEELKQTTISDKEHILEENATLTTVPITEDKVMEESRDSTISESAVTEEKDELMRERISSPKKKRGRDDDEAKDIDSPEKPGESAEGLNGSRTFREKKRPRDTTGDSPEKGAAKPKDLSDNSPTTSSDSESKRSRNSSPKPVFGSNLTSNKPQTSSSAFASSGFASLASSSSSPFGTVGASSPSIFGGGKPSDFSALAGPKSSTATTTTTTSTNTSDKPASAFGFGGASSTSGFGSLKSGSVFGSTVANGFAGGAGPKLSSFAAPVTAPSKDSSKPAKAFGAPESEEEEDSGEDDGEGSANESGEEFGKAVTEDKKKMKAVKIEDGESGEATLLQVRAKLFAMESKESGWKERGSGTLKVNVPKSCVTFDHLGVPMPGSFDISGLEDEDDENAPRVPRLIMRQDNTHRVILNSTIIRAMEFTDKPSGQGGVQYLFTTLSDPKPIQMLLRMNENNGRLFRSEMDSIRHEL